MHATRILSALALIAAAGPALAEPAIWGLQVEQLEYRFGEDEDVLAWDFDAVAGTDELRFVWRSEAELLSGPGTFETLENQARVQVPIEARSHAAQPLRDPLLELLVNIAHDDVRQRHDP